MLMIGHNLLFARDCQPTLLNVVWTTGVSKSILLVLRPFASVAAAVDNDEADADTYAGLWLFPCPNLCPCNTYPCRCIFRRRITIIIIGRANETSTFLSAPERSISSQYETFGIYLFWDQSNVFIFFREKLSTTTTTKKYMKHNNLKKNAKQLSSWTNFQWKNWWKSIWK